MKSSFLGFPIFVATEQLQFLATPLSPEKADFLVLWESESQLDDALQVFLGKILKAIGKSTEDNTALAVLQKGGKTNLAATLRERNIRYVLIFGIAPEALGFSIQPPLYQPFSIGSFHLLWGHDLPSIYRERMEGGETKARPLWVGLQQLFKSNQ